jgi:hypothetical protein
VSETFGINIRFERLRLSFPLNLSAGKVLATGAGNDTLLCMDKLTLHVRPLPLLKGNISVTGIRLAKVRFDTGSLIDGVAVKGCAGDIFLQADSVNPANAYARLNKVTLSDADVDVFICDTAASAETSGDDWLIDLKKLEFHNVAFSCHMPCDSFCLSCRIDEAALSGGVADVGAGAYGVSALRLDMPELSCNTDLRDAAPGFDPAHIHISDLHLLLDSSYYESGGAGKIQALLKECSARERSGIVLRSVTGRIVSDSVRLRIPSLSLQTDCSTLQMQVDMPWQAIDSVMPAGDLSLSLSAGVGRDDVMFFAGGLPEDFRRHYPDTSFRVELSAFGNTGYLTLNRLTAHLPGALRMNLSGSVKSPVNEKLRAGKLLCRAEMQDPDFVTALLPASMQGERIRIPDSLSVAGEFAVDRGVYAAGVTIRDGEGRVSLSGKYDHFRKSYEARLDVDSLEPVHFLPADSLLFLNAGMSVKGQGTDFYRPSTWAEAEGKISEIRYGNSSMSEISLKGSLRNNHLQAALNSAYPLIRGRLSIDGDIRKDGVKGMLIADVDTVDFYGLKLTDAPLATSFQIFAEIESNLAKKHAFDVTLGNWNILLEGQTIQPKMLTLAFRSDEDTVRTSFHAGDLNIMLTGNVDVNTLTEKMTRISAELGKQLQRDSTVDVQALRPGFPDMSVRIDAGRDNPLYNFMQEQNMFFDTFSLNADVSPEDGLRIDGALLAFVKDTLKIDTIRLSVWQDTLGLQYRACVAKKRFRNQEAFQASAHGYIRRDEADVFASYVNSSGAEGLHLGVNIRKAGEGFDFRLYPQNPVIAFLPFTVNDDNRFRFRSLTDMEADIRLENRDLASLWVHSGAGAGAGADAGAGAMKELMIELERINLKNVSARFGGLPSLKGLLNVTFRYEPAETSFTVIADAGVDDFHYEDGRIGNLLLNATYVPVENGAHQIDMHVFHDLSEVSSLSVLYREGRQENRISGVISVDRLPLNLFNAMIPGRTARMEGALLGDFLITGTDRDPLVDGTLQVEKGSIHIVPSSTTLRLDDRPVKVTKNKVSLDKYHIYTLKDNPLVIDGVIDATNTGRPTASLRVSATNLQLVDSKKTPGSLAYGRLSTNLNTTLTGPLQALRMRGDLRILGSTNLTYVMLDSPLEVQDGFNELVTFRYFADTLPRRTRRPFNFVRGTRDAAAMSGTDVLVNVRIDPVVRMRINLDEEQSNFVEMRGGGDLSLQYSAQGEMRLNGRYTLSDGTLRYSIPVIPLTDFSIRNGSYVDWTGNPMNPNLNITAYTRVRAAAEVDGLRKMVDFNAGIRLRNSLDAVSVQFILEAPSDAVVQSQLASMGEEERSKQAISLLVTGVYLAGKGAGSDNLDVGMALNSLLQREIKNMLGSLLGDVPFSFDAETYDGTEQGMGRRIDYIGRFYKSFLNERLNTTLGLRYSTKDMVYGNKLFLDDISLEYMLDANGERAVKTFLKKEYENLFEGEITKIGASFSLSRKVKRFRDLFIPRKQDAMIKEEEPEDEGTPPGGNREAPDDDDDDDDGPDHPGAGITDKSKVRNAK